jgi:O-antigen ligase
MLLLVGLGWLARLAVSRSERVLLRTPLNRVIMLYIGSCVFATLIGLFMGKVRPVSGFFFLLKYYEYFFLYFMTVHLVHDPTQIRRFVNASFLTCALVSLYAISQIPSGERVSAPFEGETGEPNTLGGYLVLMMAIAVAFLVTPGAVTKKGPLLGLVGLQSIALQATLSRASFLAAAVVTIAVLLYLRRRSPMLIGILLMGLVVFPFVAPKAVVDRVAYTFTQPQEEGQLQIGKVRVDTSTSERLQSWRHGLDVWIKSPLWGHGVTGGPFMDAMYPRVLTEVGLLGLCAFLALQWGIFRTAKTSIEQVRDPYLRGLSLGVLLGLIGLIVHSVGSNTFIIVRIMEPFWLFTALMVRALMLERAGAETGIPSQSPQLRA